MNFKRFSTSDNQWHDVPYYIHNTSTDTLTTLPAVLYPNAVTATVGLKGDMVQTSQPSPTTPIQPQECGERTGNLFDISTATNEFINSNGSITSATAGDPYYLSDYISADNVTISVQFKETASSEIFSVGIYDASKSFIRRDVISNNSVSYDNVAYIRINYRDKNCQNVMLNTGSTPLPYEPYGVKIPILSNSTTTNVYLGEVESTRRIIKYEFNGSEAWAKNSASVTEYIYYLANLKEGLTRIDMLCSHLPIATSGISPTNAGVQLFSNKTTLLINVGSDVMNAQPSGNTVDGLKEYLAAQYATGTPVTIWYVLAEQTIGILNEPLRKIGDYADTVSGITIPTIAGANTIDVDTTLKPSEVSVNYHGWHPVQNVHERENGAWD